ncbi:hypothetical protein V5799_008596 [Amblyomma americanum]|uniref:Uncharacterized protein n=1 Tax=Amblyomma americanum TaxID=6943 RepID=A0AAQ4FE74_AMBAM
MVSYPTLYVAAEFSQQTILMRVDPDSHKRYDWKIMLRYMVFATTVSAPFLHYWYRYLDRAIPAKGTKEAIQKALADQAVSSTIILAIFYPGESARCSLSSSREVLSCLRSLQWYAWVQQALFTREQSWVI